MNKEKMKTWLKAVAIIYVVSFFILNWNDVSWIFNYKAVYGLVYDFFNPFPSIDANSMDVYFYPNHSQPSSSASVTPQTISVKTNYTEKQNTLEIPKINIEVPIVFSSSSDKNALMKDLDLGVVYYPGSVYPGQTGQIVILGHSAPVGWPKIKHDWVFSDLEKLETGDKIMIDLNSKQYVYIVKQTNIIKSGADIPSMNGSNVLTLISCWPPGKDYQRIAVQAVLDS